MRVQNEPTQASVNGAAPPSAVKLSAGELDAVLQGAIARHGDSKSAEPAGTTLEEALDIARQLDIPEEHVLASVQDLQKLRLRQQRRELAKARRRLDSRVTLVIAAVVGAIGATLGLRGGFSPLALLTLGGAAMLVFWALRAAMSPVTDAEADAFEIPPVAGVCRTCGVPAITSKATFCEAHRYKGPSG